MTSVLPIAFTASPVGKAAMSSSLPSTASKPRFMLAPWSPSPIAWSSADSSSALAMIRSAAAAISDLKMEPIKSHRDPHSAATSMRSPAASK